jgi:hypothetical protein
MNYEKNIWERHKTNLITGGIIVILALICNAVFGQLPMKEGKVFYETIDSVNMSKEQLYKKAKVWLVNTFNDSKAVIEIDDSDKIVGKGNFIVNYTYALTPSKCKFNFTVNLDFKDNKYRMQIYNIIAEFALNYETPVENIEKQYGKNINKKLLPEVDKNITDLMSDFKITLSKQDSF